MNVMANLRAKALAESEALRHTFPLAPLEHVLFASNNQCGPDDPRRTMRDVCQLVGVSTDTWYKRRRTGLTLAEADDWAYAVGYHPWEIWGDRWWAIDIPQESTATSDPQDGSDSVTSPLDLGDVA